MQHAHGVKRLMKLANRLQRSGAAWRYPFLRIQN
jgi:hypothetical protein